VAGPFIARAQALERPGYDEHGKQVFGEHFSKSAQRSKPHRANAGHPAAGAD